jgi:hypothetical protein
LEGKILAFLTNKWAIISIVILCWAAIASFAAGYYAYQYTDLSKKVTGTIATVNIGIDYGNSTRTWYNNTAFLIGMSLFDITRHIANVTHEVHPTLGIWIEAINDVKNAPDYSRYWVWWKWNGTSWEVGELGAGSYIIGNGEIILWYYTYYDATLGKEVPPQ